MRLYSIFLYPSYFCLVSSLNKRFLPFWNILPVSEMIQFYLAKYYNKTILPFPNLYLNDLLDLLTTHKMEIHGSKIENFQNFVNLQLFSKTKLKMQRIKQKLQKTKKISTLTTKRRKGK